MSQYKKYCLVEQRNDWLCFRPKQIPDLFADETIKKIGKKYHKTNAQIALKYLHQRNIIVIPKNTESSMLKENMNILDFELDSEDLAALNSLEIGPKARVIDWSFFPG